MKYILFLGGNGFLGKNVLQYFEEFLVEQEHIHFVVAGRFSQGANADALGNVTYEVLDFSDKAALGALFEKYAFSEVFHFASSTVPANSNEQIHDDIRTNLLGTIALLEYMVQHRTQKITYISSGGTVYGNTGPGGSQEEDFNNPNNSYGIVKLSIEKYINLFHKLYGLDYLILRLSNPFGPGHLSERNGIINIAIRRALLHQPIVVWGDGSNTKDYIFVKDFSRIFWTLFSKNISNKILNIGSGNVYSVMEVLENIKKILPELHWEHAPAKSFDTRKVEFKLDSLKKIMPLANTEFLKALEATCAWEKARLNNP
jgi:UDP-glucose 4-epimerase